MNPTEIMQHVETLPTLEDQVRYLAPLFHNQETRSAIEATPEFKAWAVKNCDQVLNPSGEIKEILSAGRTKQP